jgi:hypothetical protein
MIDLSAETLLSFAEAAHVVPPKGVNVSTVHRWGMDGVNGIKLESLRVAGRRYTSHEALLRFFAATTAAADGNASPSRTPRQRERDIQTAERELDIKRNNKADD